MTEADNFVFGDFFADVKCRFGHEVRMFNIGRDHFVACDKCRTYIFKEKLQEQKQLLGGILND